MNWGILLLAASGGLLLFLPATEGLLRRSALAYGIGLALTFDEFGMWLHLGGGYWQRASFDAIVVVAGLLGTVAYAPRVPRLRPRHLGAALLLAAGTAVFGWLLWRSFDFVGEHLGPELRHIESDAPR